MLDFVVKLNDRPGTLGAADVDRLRAAGFDDEGVIDVVMVCAFFNFMNRLAEGLGPSPNPAFVKSRARRDAKFSQADANPD